MNQIIKNTLALFAITAVAGFLLGAVYEGTKEARAEQAIKKKHIRQYLKKLQILRMFLLKKQKMQ